MEKFLYRLARKINKAATFTNDVKTYASLDPKRIAKRIIRKQTYKKSHGAANSLSQKISKWIK